MHGIEIEVSVTGPAGRKPKAFRQTIQVSSAPFDCLENAFRATRNDITEWALKEYRDTTAAPYHLVAAVEVDGTRRETFEVKGETDGGLGGAIAQAAYSLHDQIGAWATQARAAS